MQVGIVRDSSHNVSNSSSTKDNKCKYLPRPLIKCSIKMFTIDAKLRMWRHMHCPAMFVSNKEIKDSRCNVRHIQGWGFSHSIKDWVNPPPSTRITRLPADVCPENVKFTRSTWYVSIKSKNCTNFSWHLCGNLMTISFAIVVTQHHKDVIMASAGIIKVVYPACN